VATRLDVSRRNAEIRASSEPTGVLAARYGLDRGQVSRIRSEPTRPLTRKERFQLEVLDGGWVAACMEPDEWAHWLATNPQATIDSEFADRPCRDCPLTFATEMRALGRCNGTPAGLEGAPATRDDPEDDVTDQRSSISGGVRGQSTLALTAPPCDTCLHEPICVLKIALRKVTTAEITVAPLPDGLSIALEARVDCRFYNAKPGFRRKHWSPEAREAARQRALTRNTNPKAAA